MSVREKSWVRKPSPEVAHAMEAAVTSRFYVLREIGPTSFVLQTQESQASKPVRVQIGSTHSCSCSSFASTSELCEHILFVMLKIYRLNSDNPLAWQLGLLDDEITGLLSGRTQRQQASQKPHAGKFSTKRKVTRKPIAKEDVCAICYDALKESEGGLVFCKHGCGNSLHGSCMQVWANHHREELTCPICRANWGPLIVPAKHKLPKKVPAIHSEKCGHCHTFPIKGCCYKCTQCSHFSLCETCFQDPLIHAQHALLQFAREGDPGKHVPRGLPLSNSGGGSGAGVATSSETDRALQGVALGAVLVGKRLRTLAELTKDTNPLGLKGKSFQRSPVSGAHLMRGQQKQQQQQEQKQQRLDQPQPSLELSPPTSSAILRSPQAPSEGIETPGSRQQVNPLTTEGQPETWEVEEVLASELEVEVEVEVEVDVDAQYSYNNNSPNPNDSYLPSPEDGEPPLSAAASSTATGQSLAWAADTPHSAYSEEFLPRESNSPNNDVRTTERANHRGEVAESLLFRELTPNDYDRLLALGDTAPPARTLSMEEVACLPRIPRPTPANIGGGGGEGGTAVEDAEHEFLATRCGTACPICLEDFEVGEEEEEELVTQLPFCGHVFHPSCIEEWLTHHRGTCPVDGQPVYIAPATLRAAGAAAAAAAPSSSDIPQVYSQQHHSSPNMRNRGDNDDDNDNDEYDPDDDTAVVIAPRSVPPPPPPPTTTITSTSTVTLTTASTTTTTTTTTTSTTTRTRRWVAAQSQLEPDPRTCVFGPKRGKRAAEAVAVAATVALRGGYAQATRGVPRGGTKNAPPPRQPHYNPTEEDLAALVVGRPPVLSAQDFPSHSGEMGGVTNPTATTSSASSRSSREGRRRSRRSLYFCRQ